MPAFEFWNDAGATIHPVSMADYLPRPQLREVQLHRLKVVVERAYTHVPLMRQRMDERCFKPEDLRTLADIAKLPFTVKADLRDTYPFGLFASPLSDIVRLHASSGTTGKPIVVAYTQNDMEVWKNVIMRTMAAGGVRRGDILQNAYGYGLFTGGLGVHYGAEALGVTVIPISGGNTDRQLMVLQDFGVTAITCTPSYFLHIADEAAKHGIDMQKLSLRVGFFGAEPWTEEMRQRIQSLACIRAYDIYGLSEIIGPGVAAECQEQCGLHIFEDHFYPEIIDPDTGKTLPDGATGELVLTTLSKEAMPMLRYRTRDISQLVAEPCACGRTLRRLRRISARSDDMLIIRGVNVYPTQIEAALLKVDAVLPHYQITVTREHDLDQMDVQVEVLPAYFSDEVKSLEALRRRIGEAIEHTTGVRARVQLVEPNTVKRSEGKAQRVRDLRKLK
ncbi:MAG: phenylacetate--CoA ligase [Kiritimatiellae bacterium]|nr:phenylacetate--CoA ligase [Kiritimatiellia bacterium]